MKRTLAAAAVGVCLSACSSSPDYSKEYPGPWLGPSEIVTHILATKKVRGCDKYYQKLHAQARNLFLAACTRDGRTWRGYIVWQGPSYVEALDDSVVLQLGPPNQNSN